MFNSSPQFNSHPACRLLELLLTFYKSSCCSRLCSTRTRSMALASCRAYCIAWVLFASMLWLSFFHQLPDLLLTNVSFQTKWIRVILILWLWTSYISLMRWLNRILCAYWKKYSINTQVLTATGCSAGPSHVTFCTLPVSLGRCLDYSKTNSFLRRVTHLFIEKLCENFDPFSSFIQWQNYIIRGS